MKTSIEKTWEVASQKASNNLLNPDAYLIFLVDENSDKKTYGGVDGSGSHLLAIEVKTKPPTAAIRSDALDYFRHQRKDFDTWLMVLRLRNKELSPVFGRLCQDLIDEIAGIQHENDLVKLVHRRLTLWQKLFDRGNAGLLADFQVKGLIAELLSMNSILDEQRYGISEVAAAWVGPYGGDQDFQFSDTVIEIKAVGPGAQGISISSLKQLDSRLPISLSVWTLRPAATKETAAITLNGIVAQLEQRLAPESSALTFFRDALLEAGYVEQTHYDGIAFEPMQVEHFTVDDDFPRLTVDKVPEGIDSAVYVISLKRLRKQ